MHLSCPKIPVVGGLADSLSTGDHFDELSKRSERPENHPERRPKVKINWQKLLLPFVSLSFYMTDKQIRRGVKSLTTFPRTIISKIDHRYLKVNFLDLKRGVCPGK